MANNNEYISTNNFTNDTFIEVMNNYDNLHPEIRKIFQNANFNLTVSDDWKDKINSYHADYLKQKLQELEVKSTIATYGANHPDAQ